MQVTAGVTTNAVHGEFTAMEAVSRMLAGTRIAATFDGTTGVLTVKRIVPNPKNMNTTTTKLRRAILGHLPDGGQFAGNAQYWRQ